MRKMILLAACATMLAGCAKNEGQDPDTGKARIDFSAGLDVVPTKATEQSVSLGTHASMWVYTKNDAPGTATAQVNAKEYNVVTTAGTFDPVGTGDAAMYLNYGDYDFYSVGVVNYHAMNYPLPVFSGTPNGATSDAGLKNEADYIFAKVAAHTVGAAANTKTVALQYAHAAVNVELTVAAGSGMVLTDVTAAKITPSDPAAPVMSLTDGTITQAPSILAETGAGSGDNLKSMVAAADNTANGSSWVFSYIMLPLAKSQTLTVELTVSYTLNGTPVTGKTFTGTLTTPDGTPGGFISGNRYKYSVKVNGNGLSFAACKVTDWTDNTHPDDIPATEN